MFALLAFFLVLTICFWKETQKGYLFSLKIDSQDHLSMRIWRWGTPKLRTVQMAAANVTAKPPLPTTAIQATMKKHVSAVPAGSNFVTKELVDAIKVWNKNSSSKNLTPRLQIARKNYLSMNKYHVRYTGAKSAIKQSPEEVLCQFRKRLNFQMISSLDDPFRSPDWQASLPVNNISTEVGRLGRCAVVSSAGSMKSSHLGHEIGVCYSLMKTKVAKYCYHISLSGFQGYEAGIIFGIHWLHCCLFLPLQWSITIRLQY